MKEKEYKAKIVSKSHPGFRFFMILLFTIVIGIKSIYFAQENNTISKEEQRKLVKAICEKLEQLYPFPEIGIKTSKGILKNFKEGKYSKYTDPGVFADNLTIDLEEISNDKHLDLLYNPKLAARIKEQEDKGGEGAFVALEAKIERWNNYGFKELKILAGNIGYMDLRLFFSTRYAGATAVAAMNFFSNCNALIIDLRKNSGGWDDMVTLLASYFFDSDDAVIFDISRSSKDDSYYSSMTSLYVPGKKQADIPLYILTSKSTASAAEGFAHRMKHLNRNAVLVGEKTAGAENPVEYLAISNEFVLKIPCWRKIYSSTDSNWEGVGVKPDIEVKEDKALKVAHMEALKKLVEGTTDENTKMRYQWAYDGVNARNNPVSVAESILQSYVGKYRNRTISYENGKLYYRYRERLKRKMIPISDSYFLVENYDFFRVRFKKEKDVVVGFEEIFTNGRIIKNYKE
ncbi:MAG: hypothetical protein GTO45_10440 [Candidatus Aminicenantes bacterium]|nr:hypothetical protein [Candidatus Aminicenantes bacterium]NIM79225.1 hypothetical protein [Candidatus Aminicenantes bacterium]NIN18503.1 hypothetical protein [Candidatus Aminicenantes bacterium]NIN42399.1 hypothetical protein [Candidatus Aminicenantes bacterium]NIN85166.1 hypothetical protein [Candidatus Aminicenantes bacterium]